MLRQNSIARKYEVAKPPNCNVSSGRGSVENSELEEFIDTLLEYTDDNNLDKSRDTQSIIIMVQRKAILKQYKYSVWLAGDGYWKTKHPVVVDGKTEWKIVKRRTKEALENVIIEWIEGERAGNLTLKEVYLEWLDYRSNMDNLAKSTRDRYARDFKRYLENDELNQKKIRDIEADELSEKIKQWVKKYSLTTKSFGNMKTLLRGIFKYAKHKRYCSLEIDEILEYAMYGNLNVKKQTNEYNSQKADVLEAFTLAEEKRLTDYLEKQEDVLSLGILLLFYTGMRIGELVSLTPDDINLEEQSIRINKSETTYKDEEQQKNIFVVQDSTKTAAGTRTVYIVNEAIPLLRKLLENSKGMEYLFMKQGRRVCSYSFRDKLYRLCDAFKIPKRSLHKIRKTYITKLIDAGVPENVIIQQVGHTDFKTTKAYYYRNNKDWNDIRNSLEKQLSD